jgi:hypothetical protein
VETTSETEQYSPEIIEAEVQKLCNWTLLTPQYLQGLYKEAMDAGDAQCPGFDYQMEEGSVPLEGCMASTGWHYRGLSEYSETQGETTLQWGLTLGDFYITAAVGDEFAVGGTFEYMADIIDGNPHWSAETTGSFQYAGQGGWLEEGAGVALWLSGTEGTGIEINGGIGTLEAENDLFFEQFILSEFSTEGVLKWRSPEQDWYTLRFDGSTDDCALLINKFDQELGTICLDLTTIRNQLWMEFSP